MVDKGFDLETDLPVGVTLSIPLCHRDKKHLSIQEETETRRIASLRIHVERAIARIKNHNMLKTIFPIAMAAKVNKNMGCMLLPIKIFTTINCWRRMSN